MDHRVSANVGELMDAHSKISSLKLQLEEAKKELTKFKVDFDVEVEKKNATYFLVITGSANGKSFRKVISQDHVLALIVDKDIVIKDIAVEFLVALAGESAREELHAKLAPAFENIAALAAKGV